VLTGVAQGAGLPVRVEGQVVSAAERTAPLAASALLWSWTPFRFSAEGLRSLCTAAPSAPSGGCSVASRSQGSCCC